MSISNFKTQIKQHKVKVKMTFQESKDEFRVLRGSDSFKLGLKKNQYASKSFQGVLTY